MGLVELEILQRSGTSTEKKLAGSVFCQIDFHLRTEIVKIELNRIYFSSISVIIFTKSKN